MKQSFHWHCSMKLKHLCSTDQNMIYFNLYFQDIIPDTDSITGFLHGLYLLTIGMDNRVVWQAAFSFMYMHIRILICICIPVETLFQCPSIHVGLSPFMCTSVWSAKMPIAPCSDQSAKFHTHLRHTKKRCLYTHHGKRDCTYPPRKMWLYIPSPWRTMC